MFTVFRSFCVIWCIFSGLPKVCKSFPTRAEWNSGPTADRNFANPHSSGLLYCPSMTVVFSGRVDENGGRQIRPERRSPFSD